MVTSTVPNPQQNHLLDALPKGEYDRIAPNLELVPLQLGDVVYESGATLRWIQKSPVLAVYREGELTTSGRGLTVTYQLRG